MPQSVSLDSLVVGQRGVIRQVAGNDAITQRLMEMGVNDDEIVELIARAPLGDPLEIRIRGYQLSLRISEAKRILVEPTAGGAS